MCVERLKTFGDADNFPAKSETFEEQGSKPVRSWYEGAIENTPIRSTIILPDLSQLQYTFVLISYAATDSDAIGT